MGSPSVSSGVPGDILQGNGVGGHAVIAGRGCHRPARFLLLNFITGKPVVGLCECCGRFFMPRTERKTLYCDRVIKDGKTCKALGPRLKHKLLAKNKTVVEAFDRARQRMYKRYERARDINQHPSDTNLK